VPPTTAPTQLPINLNVTVEDERKRYPQFPYPVAPDLLVGGAIDPLLLGPASPAPTTAAPATAAPVPQAFSPAPETVVVNDTALEQPGWSWQNTVITLVVVVAVGIAGYYAWKSFSGKNASAPAAVTATAAAIAAPSANNRPLNLGNAPNDFSDLDNIGLPPTNTR